MNGYGRIGRPFVFEVKVSRNLGFNAMLGKNRVVRGSGNYCRQGNILLCLGLAYPKVSRDLAASRCSSGTRPTYNRKYFYFFIEF